MKSYLAEYMEATGESYRSLFKKTGIAQQTIANAIYKPEKRTIDLFRKLADHFGVCFRDMLDVCGELPEDDP